MVSRQPKSTRTDTLVPMTTLFRAEADTGKRGGASQSEKRGGFGLARSLLGSLTGGAIGGSGDAVLDVADSAIGKSEEEILAEELALGPELAGRSRKKVRWGKRWSVRVDLGGARTIKKKKKE